MGKLHSLRRAILREPHRWNGRVGALRERNGQWYPCSGFYWYTFHGYHNFIKSVLRDAKAPVGQADSGQDVGGKTKPHQLPVERRDGLRLNGGSNPPGGA